MIQNIEKGRGFKGAVKYAKEKDQAIRISGTMVGDSVEELTKEAGKIRGLNPKLNKAVFHVSLSISPDDNLTVDQWREIADKYMQKTGFENAPYCVFHHKDTDHDHIHIVALRIDATTGKTISDSKDFERGALVVQEIEQEYGLTQAALTPEQARNKPVKNLKREEVEKAIRTGEAPVRQVLQQVVDEAIIDQPDIFEFIDRLEMAGVQVQPAVAKTGRMNGFSFTYNDLSFKASDLGKQYGWKQLQQEVIYDQATESGRLIEIASAARARSNQNNIGAGLDGERFVAIDVGIDRGNTISIDSAQGVTGEPGINIEPERVESGIHDAGSSTRNQIDAGRIPGTENNIDQLDATGAAEAKPIATGYFVGSERDAIADIGRIVDEVSDIAAPVIPKDHAAKIAAWERQHDALQSPFYRITIVPRRDPDKKTFNLGKQKDGQERFFSADDVKNLIPQLRRQNAIGNDIYITPIDDAHHYVLLDDTTREQVEELKRRGLQPVLVQQSSAGNVQAVFKADRDSSRREEQSDANRMMSILNKKYGDEKISAVIHPFRMAGFANAKPGKEIDGKRPFTTILETSPGNSKMTEWLQMIREETDKKSSSLNKKDESKRREQVIYGIDNGKNKFGYGDARSAYAREYKRQIGLYEKLWKPQGKDLNLSVVDYRIAQELLKNGYEHRQIENAIVDMSPEMNERHSNPVDYAGRTVSKAASSKDVIKALAKAK